MPANWTGQQLTIEHSAHGVLTASHSSSSPWVTPALLLVFALGALSASFRLRQRTGMGFSGLWALAMVVWLSLLTGTTVSRMTVDPETNQITWSRTFRGQVKEQRSATLTDFASVDLAQNPAGRRLVLVAPNGVSILPLSDDWLYDDRLYLLRDELRNQMNRRNPTSPSTSNPKF